MPELDQEIMQELTKWAADTQDEVRTWMEANRLKVSGKLISEFIVAASSTRPGEFHIDVNFPRYGIYVNFGSGRGYKNGAPVNPSVTEEYKKGPRKEREKQEFYTQIFWSNLREIRELMADKYKKFITFRIMNELKS